MTKEVVLLKLEKCPASMLSHWLIGTVEERLNDTLKLSSVVNLYESVNAQGHISQHYVSDHMHTEGIIQITKMEYLYSRKLVENDPVEKGYLSSLAQYRGSKVGIISPNDNRFKDATAN